jgi:hypothetical protein
VMKNATTINADLITTTADTVVKGASINVRK